MGYVCVILGFGVTIYYRCKKNLLKASKSLFATSLLTITYLLTNLQLLSSLFGQEGYMTHRSEMQLVATGFIGKVVELLFQGGSYSKVYSTFVLIATIIVIFFSFTLIHDKKEHERLWNNLHKINIVFLCIIIGVLLAALWNCNFVVSIRNAIGGMITYFQADRIYWIFPFLWMLLLALVLNAFLIYLEEYHRSEERRVGKEC